MRQTTGYMEDYWATRGLDIAVPSFGQLCDRFAALEANVTQRCEQLARRLARGEAVSLIVDSTGLSFARAGQWYEEKYGKKADRTPWRKMHLSIDADMNIHAIRITTTEVSDSEGMDAILPADLPVDRVIADGAYYSSSAAKRCPGPASRRSYHRRLTRSYTVTDRRTRQIHQGQGYLCVPQEIRLRPALARRGADLAHQAMHWRHPADAEDRVAGVRGRHHRQHHQPVEFLRQA
jgi:hypothetical protein